MFGAAASLCLWVSAGLAAESSPWLQFDEIRVGVRADARPFSYALRGNGSDSLNEYNGYVVEICKEVIAGLRRTRPFNGTSIVAVEVTAKNRLEMLSDYQIDVLCDPTSITRERLESYDISLPVFLSGVTYAYVDPAVESYPRRVDYCGSIVGLVEGTTAEETGLERLIDDEVFLRFQSAVEQQFADIQADTEPDKARYVTSECPDGHEQLPIRLFADHDTGLKAFCNQEVLYYVADVDILSSYILDHHCNAVVNRYAVTRELYGIFFPPAEKLDSSGDAVVDRDRITRGLFLYARFNMMLMELMQGQDNVMSRAFDSAFAGRTKTPDLEQFFRSFQFSLE